jgi:hypothetical protein
VNNNNNNNNKDFFLYLEKIVPLCLRVYLSLHCLIFGFLRNKHRKCPLKVVLIALNSYCNDFSFVLHRRPRSVRHVWMYCTVRVKFCNCLVTTNIRSYADNPLQQICISTVSSLAYLRFQCDISCVYIQALGICTCLHESFAVLKIHAILNISMSLSLETHRLTAPLVNLSWTYRNCHSYRGVKVKTLHGRQRTQLRVNHKILN